jgi:hypothetical protein
MTGFGDRDAHFEESHRDDSVSYRQVTRIAFRFDVRAEDDVDHRFEMLARYSAIKVGVARRFVLHGRSFEELS